MEAIVIGSGIAGPATAMALDQVGIRSVVLERRRAPDREAGSYVTLAPNGLDALDAIGALRVARECGFATRRNVMVGASGRILGEVPSGMPLDDGTIALTLKRSALAADLAAEAERRGIEVRYGARVDSIEDLGGAAEVRLSDGSVQLTDLVIGADGVHSMVRRAIDPEAPAARYVGLTNFGGITRAAELRDGVAADLPEESWHFVFGRRAFFGAHPMPSGDVAWFANVPRPLISSDERAATSDEQWRQWLIGLLAADEGPGADLVRRGTLELAGDNTHDLGHVPTWHRGRMVVLGDAAHAPAPSSGQGASMALEDAVLLAAALRGRQDPRGALSDFERNRRPRVERIVAAGARSSSAKIPGLVGRVFRDALLRLVFRHLMSERSTSWMTGHRVDADAVAPVVRQVNDD